MASHVRRRRRRRASHDSDGATARTVRPASAVTHDDVRGVARVRAEQVDEGGVAQALERPILGVF